MVCALEADFFTKFLNTSAKKKIFEKVLGQVLLVYCFYFSMTERTSK